MWILKLLFGNISNDTNNEKEDLSEGNYSSYNFEEEELEEDDYYFEDDV